MMTLRSRSVFAVMLVLLAMPTAMPSRADERLTVESTEQNAPTLATSGNRIIDVYVTRKNGVRRCAYKLAPDFAHFGDEVVIDLLPTFTEQESPSVSVDKDGNFVIVCTNKKTGATAIARSIVANGQTTPGTPLQVDIATTGTLPKAAVAVDKSPTSPALGRAYIALEFDPAGGTGGEIDTFVSINAGQTFPFFAPVSQFAQFNKVPSVAVAPDSGRVYVAWTDVFGGQDKVFFAFSPDGGAHFTPVFVTNYTSNPQTGPTPIGICAQNANKVGVFFVDCTVGQPCQLENTWSSDGGNTWGSSWSRVAPSSHDQKSRAVACDGDPRVDVVWYEAAGEGNLYNVMQSFSTNSGQSWSPPVRISDQSVDLAAVFGVQPYGTSPISLARVPSVPPPAPAPQSVIPGTLVFPVWTGLSGIGNTDLFTVGTPAGNLLVAAILPGSRSVAVGVPATAFVTVINTGTTTATAVGITLITAIPATFSYQTTDPATNALTGSPNTPVDIPAGGFKTFVIAITPTAPFPPSDIALSFAGANTVPVRTLIGLNTLLGSGSATPVPDIVALAATLNNDGIVNIPGATGTGAFAVATVNVGAGAQITVTADTGGVSLPVTITLCQTNPTIGDCQQPPSASVTTQINANATPTFAVFVTGSSVVSFDPANNRIVVSGRDAGGVVRGRTSVAVRTQP